MKGPYSPVRLRRFWCLESVREVSLLVGDLRVNVEVLEVVMAEDRPESPVSSAASFSGEDTSTNPAALVFREPAPLVERDPSELTDVSIGWGKALNCTGATLWDTKTACGGESCGCETGGELSWVWPGGLEAWVLTAAGQGPREGSGEVGMNWSPGTPALVWPTPLVKLWDLGTPVSTPTVVGQALCKAWLDCEWVTPAWVYAVLM